ncbi:MAG: hypothetical protein ACO3A8_05905 [Steroidobacteraceae bacterium]|jgi:tetratricopeptide (TPR) repeat protein
MAGFTLSFRKALIATTTLLWAGVANAQTPAGAPAADAAVRERGESFLKFKAALDANDLVGARLSGEELVASTERQFGQDARELVAPLTNLGTVAYRRGDYALAEKHYLRAIRIVDGREAGADRVLLRPLTGLGETYLAERKFFEGAAALKRALDLSRNLDGLFNPEQLDILDPLLECYVALGQKADADKEHQYGFRVAEAAFGKNDLRMIEALDRLAAWHEANDRYATARGLHARALQIVEQYATARPVLGVPALRGLARTYLFEVIVGPEGGDEAAEIKPRDPFGMPAVEQGRLNPDGERALKYALEVLGNGQPLDRRTRADTFVQLGNWYLIGGSLSRAAAEYKRAWTEVAPLGEAALASLRKPRLLAYKPPSISAKRSGATDDDAHEIVDVRLALKVGRDGKVIAVKTADDSIAEAASRPVMTAARRARFSPAIADGEPIEVDGVPFEDRVIVKSKAKPAATPATDDATAGSAPPRSP